MAMIWNSGMGTPMPSATPEAGRDYTPSSSTGYFDGSGRAVSGGYGSGGGGNGYGSTGATSDIFDRYIQGETDARAEAKRQFDVKYELDKKNADRNYQVAMMGARTQQDQQRAVAEYQQAQTAIARERLAFDRDTQAQNFGLQQAGLGYNLLKTGAELRGPANYYQASEYARGASQMPQTSTFLSALQSNARLPGFGAQGGLPDPATLNTLSAKLGGGAGAGATGGAGAGGGAAPGGYEANSLAQIGNIAARGAGQLGAGSLEQLTPTEYGLFTSGLDKLGVDTPTFLDQYRRSRIGQGAGAGYRAA